MTISKFLQNNRLFRECVESLHAELLSLNDSNKITILFEKTIPMTKWGKIDWEKIDKKINIGYDPIRIIPALEELIKESLDKSVYIEWSDGGLPVIKTNLDAVINHFDDVTCVSFEKFIFNPQQGYIIEILASDEMTVGVVEL